MVATGGTLVVGDMHCKEEPILARVDLAIEKCDVSRVVFCGDYVDEWFMGPRHLRDALAVLREWVVSRRQGGLTVDMVLGNHDMQYVMREAGPGTQPELYDDVADAMGELGVTIANTVEGWLVTHAGVTAGWAARHLDLGGDVSAERIAAALNGLLRAGDRDSLRALMAVGPGRGGCEVPSPLWAHQGELLDDPLLGVDQIVGHTPVRGVYMWDIPGEPRLVFCDTFGMTPMFEVKGDGGMVLVGGAGEGEHAREGEGASSGEGGICVVGSEELGCESWYFSARDWLMAN